VTESANLENTVITFVCIDGPGIVNAISGAILGAGGNIVESHQYSSPDTGRFFMRIETESGVGLSGLAEVLEPVAKRFEARLRLYPANRPVRTLILASKEAHAVAALLARQHDGTLPITVPLVLANHPDLEPLAAFYGVPFEQHAVLPETKPRMEARIREVVQEQQIELVVLARYMQILSPELCEYLAGRAINIHHSFLPGFKGANPYRQAHERGVKIIGATAHFVTADLDEGPIIDQRVSPVNHSKTVAQLKAIGADIESSTLSKAVHLFAEHRVLLDGIRTVVFD
jgi:formyltetrahydrofolate deformylase